MTITFRMVTLTNVGWIFDLSNIIIIVLLSDALTVHRSLFEMLDIFMHPRHGDGEQETTLMDYHKWTWDFHRYPSEPKKVGFYVPQSDEVVEHISQWFKKGIERYTTVVVNVLHFYIKCVVQIPDKDVSIGFEYLFILL